MDTSYWTSLNLRDKIEPTPKLFFNKYSYRVQYFCPGSGYLRDYSKRFWGQPSAYLEYRIETQKNYRAVGSWFPRSNWIEQIRLDQIENALSLVTSNKIKYRIEEPNLTFYGDDEDLLKLVVSSIGNTDRVIHLNIPSNPELLTANTVIMKRGTGYRYKIVIRDRFVRNDYISASSFIKYLDNLEDQVKVSKAVRHNLEHKNIFSHIWFYSNDISFLPMLDLIYPNCVLKVKTIEIVK
jgi:hypothetical protein